MSLSKAGYNSRLAEIFGVTIRTDWLPSTAFSVGDVVDVAGVLYECSVAHISSALFSTDVSTKWFLHKLSAAPGASLVGFQQAGTRAVSTTVQSKLRETVSVFDFMTDAQIEDVKAGTASIDVTYEIQAAITATKNKAKLIFPRGTYKVTDSLILGQGSVLAGENGFAADQRVNTMSLSTISFQPAVSKDLFTINQSDLNQGYVWGISVSGLNLVGNNLAGSRGLYLKKVASGLFENLSISNFGTGVEIEYGMFNTFNDVNSSKCLSYSFFINGTDVTTTTTFNQCIARESNYGWVFESTATGYSIGSSLNSCTMESLKIGGISQHRSCQVEYNNLYCENVPDDRVTTNGTLISLFKNGVDIQPYRSIATFNGGELAGGNFSLFSGSTVVDIGSAKRVSFTGTGMSRATSGIRCDGATADGSIFLHGINMVQVTNPFVSTSGKVVGTYFDAILTASPKVVSTADRFVAVTSFSAGDATSGGSMSAGMYRAQSLRKASVAPGSTAVLKATPTTNLSIGTFIRVMVKVSYADSPSLQYHAAYQALTCDNASSGGGTALAEYLNGTVGNFVVASAHFVVTRTGDGSITITYTCNNGGGAANHVEFTVDGMFAGASIT